MNTIKIHDDAKTPTSQLLAKCKKKFGVWSYWSDTELNINFPPPKKPTTRHFKKQVDPDLLGMSYNQMIEQKKEFATFRECLIMELQYFKETEEHLNIRGWTITSSRTPYREVARARWLGAYGEFYADWDYGDDRGPDAGGREAVSIDTLSSNPSDLESRVQSLESWRERLTEALAHIPDAK